MKINKKKLTEIGIGLGIYIGIVLLLETIRITSMYFFDNTGSHPNKVIAYIFYLPLCFIHPICILGIYHWEKVSNTSTYKKIFTEKNYKWVLLAIGLGSVFPKVDNIYINIIFLLYIFIFIWDKVFSSKKLKWLSLTLFILLLAGAKPKTVVEIWAVFLCIYFLSLSKNKYKNKWIPPIFSLIATASIFCIIQFVFIILGTFFYTVTPRSILFDLIVFIIRIIFCILFSIGPWGLFFGEHEKELLFSKWYWKIIISIINLFIISVLTWNTYWVQAYFHDNVFFERMLPFLSCKFFTVLSSLYYSFLRYIPSEVFTSLMHPFRNFLRNIYIFIFVCIAYFIAMSTITFVYSKLKWYLKCFIGVLSLSGISFIAYYGYPKMVKFFTHDTFMSYFSWIPHFLGFIIALVFFIYCAFQAYIFISLIKKLSNKFSEYLK